MKMRFLQHVNPSINTMMFTKISILSTHYTPGAKVQDKYYTIITKRIMIKTFQHTKQI